MDNSETAESSIDHDEILKQEISNNELYEMTDSTRDEIELVSEYEFLSTESDFEEKYGNKTNRFKNNQRNKKLEKN